jgi:hypothetical protein
MSIRSPFSARHKATDLEPVCDVRVELGDMSHAIIEDIHSLRRRERVLHQRGERKQLEMLNGHLPARPDNLCVANPWRREQTRGAQPRAIESGSLHRNSGRRSSPGMLEALADVHFAVSRPVELRCFGLGRVRGRPPIGIT